MVQGVREKDTETFTRCSMVHPLVNTKIVMCIVLNMPENMRTHGILHKSSVNA